MTEVVKKLRFWASDIESSGLLFDLDKQGDEKRLHNFCAIEIKDVKYKDVKLFHPHTEKTRKELQEFISAPENIFIMHNGFSYDLLALEKFGFDVSKMKLIDTLPLSFYLHKDRDRHGLEKWGEEFGVPKPVIDDWENLTQEEYDNRVIEDCKIQQKLWMKLCTEFGEIYGCKTQTDVYENRAFKYIMSKQKQLMEQTVNKWKFNVAEGQVLFDELQAEIKTRTDTLKSVMPKVAKKAKRKPPAKPYKANGELSATGERWKKLCEENELDYTKYKGVIEEIVKWEEPNPASSAQKKDWLYSLGWQPETFDFKRDGDTVRKIPQINKKNSGGLVCDSISALIEENPEVAALEGLGIVNHRSSLVKGWLENHEDGELIAGASGFTNTLRLKHRTLVNMPSSRVPYGMAIRSLLIAREGCTLTGADLSSLENRWKFHHQFPLDPDFVNSQMSDDFDPHLELAVSGGLISSDEMNFYKIVESKYVIPDECYTEGLKSMLEKAKGDDAWKDAEIGRISKIRGMGKNANYACLPMDTKILTRFGLKSFDEVSVGDTVYSYKDGKIVEDVVKFKHFYKDAEVLKFEDSKKSIRGTLNHRWITQQRNGVHTFKDISEFNTETKILTTAPYVGGVSNVTPQQAEFYGWLLSDGSTSDRYSISQSLQKDYLDVENCLNVLNIPYNKYESKRENGNHVNCYTLNTKSVKDLNAMALGVEDLNKHDFNWSAWILTLSNESRESFIEAFYKGDGLIKCSESYIITQNRGNIHDAIMLAMYLTGTGRVKSEGKGDKCANIRRHKRPYIGTQRKVITDVSIEDVFCLTTENGSFVIQQDAELLLTGNCQYGSGVETLARTAKITKAQAKKLKDGYDKLNWTIPVIAKAQKVKDFKSGRFLYNKETKIWYPLKAEKDRFSTLIQGSGSYSLDLWIAKFFKIRDKAIKSGRIKFAKLLGTFHDELILEHLTEDTEEVRKMLLEALTLANKSLKLFVDLTCDIKHGKNYGEIH